MDYIDFEVNKSKEERDEERKRGNKTGWIRDKKYGICISAFRWPPQNGGYISELISKNDAHDLCEFLDILGVSYRETEDSLKVKPSQWKNRGTLEAQATAYKRTLEKGMDASIYSSTGFTLRNEKSVSVRHGGKYVYIKETECRHGLTNEKIIATQFFINEHFDLHFPNKNWTVQFYSLKDHTPQRDYHRARIMNVVS